MVTVGRWARGTRCRRRIKQLMRGMLRRGFACTLRICVEGWKAVKSATRSLGKKEGLVRHWRLQQRAASCLTSWSSVVAMTRRLAVYTFQISGRLRRGLLRSAVSEWKVKVAQAGCSREGAMGKMRLGAWRALQHSFWVWRRYSDVKRMVAGAVGQMRRMLTRRLTERVLNTWGHFQVSQKTGSRRENPRNSGCATRVAALLNTHASCLPHTPKGRRP